MAIMDYVTPDIEKIDFEDNLFVTTELDKDTNKEIKGFIENRGGIVKNSVTKDTNYLIYKDSKEETAKYKKALDLVQEKGFEINILPVFLLRTLCKGNGIIEFGTYPFEVDGTKRPIKWAVLRQDGKKSLLLSAYGLDRKPYNERRGTITWENCTLRKWLNEEFYNAAFSDEEKKRICLTAIQNADNSRYGTSGGNDTEDQIFLLSIDEAKQYLTQTERMTVHSPYVVKHGAYKWRNGNCCWWLRSPGLKAYEAADVNEYGYIPGIGHDVNNSRIAVCPAMWIELE